MRTKKIHRKLTLNSKVTKRTNKARLVSNILTAIIRKRKSQPSRFSRTSLMESRAFYLTSIRERASRSWYCLKKPCESLRSPTTLSTGTAQSKATISSIKTVPSSPIRSSFHRNISSFQNLICPSSKKPSGLFSLPGNFTMARSSLREAKGTRIIWAIT